jgi:hypothetical protein
LILSAPLLAQADRKIDDPRFPQTGVLFQELDDGSILVQDERQTVWFQSFEEYVRSPFFQDHGLRCGSEKLLHPFARGTTADCSNSNTNPAAEYDPNGGATYTIPVVFHNLQRRNGTGFVSDQDFMNQLARLNTDFANNTNAKITFTLAGITRTKNNSWYQDGGDYWNTLAWDVNQYLNIYTNTAGGNLGYAYVPSGGGVVGNTWDRVVLYWPAVGDPAPYGAPYGMGKTGTHEVGHYLGLYHTFQGGCAAETAPGCYTSGDLICDTNPESQPNYRPCSRSTCGSPDPTNNYMDYSDDVCMDEFTAEQANRMRCTIENFRTGFTGGGGNPGLATNPSPGDGAGGVSLSATLSWSPGANTDDADVYFGTTSPPPGPVANTTGSTYDPGPLAASTTYYWRIDGNNGNGTTTGTEWSFTTTSGGGGFTLTANGYKVKGVQHADLSWGGSGAGSFDIYRDGNLIDTVGGSSYTDNLGVKGGGVTYVYQVCEAGTMTCSNTANVSF